MNVAVELPAIPVAVTENVCCVCTCVGVPEIDPVLVLKTNHEGKEGEIVYPFELIAPPEFDAITATIEFPTVTDCTEFESIMAGATSAAITVKTNVATEVPPKPVAVIV